MTPKKIQNLLPIQKRKHIIRAFISQTFPAVRVDMIHHKTDIFLRIGSKVSSFRKKTAYKFMVTFCGAFLVGSSLDHNKKYGCADFPAGRIRLLSDLKIRYRYLQDRL